MHDLPAAAWHPKGLRTHAVHKVTQCAPEQLMIAGADGGAVADPSGARRPAGPPKAAE